MRVSCSVSRLRCGGLRSARGRERSCMRSERLRCSRKNHAKRWAGEGRVLHYDICNALSHANHMCRLEAGFRLNETTLWECPIVRGRFPGAESAEAFVEAWRHRWRLVRDASRGAQTPGRRTRVPAGRRSHTRTGPTWGIKDADQHLKSLVSGGWGVLDMNVTLRNGSCHILDTGTGFCDSVGPEPNSGWRGIDSVSHFGHIYFFGLHSVSGFSVSAVDV